MKHLGTATLETKRLILRKTLESDYEPMFKNWANDERVTRFLNWQPYESAEQLKNTYHQYLLDNQDKLDFYDWKIVLKESGEPIGSIGAVNIREDIEEVEIGYCLGAAWWHTGIMTEAFQRVIKFLFEEVGVNRITAIHDPRNPHSGGVMKKCGLQYEGTSRQAAKILPGISDVIRYAILKEDYFKPNKTQGNAVTKAELEFIISRVLEQAESVKKEIGTIKNDFSDGRKLAYYEVLSIIRNELEVRDCSLQMLGFDISPEDFL